jgi:hypothetical protein
MEVTRSIGSANALADIQTANSTIISLFIGGPLLIEMTDMELWSVPLSGQEAIDFLLQTYMNSLAILIVTEHNNTCSTPNLNGSLRNQADFSFGIFSFQAFGLCW